MVNKFQKKKKKRTIAITKNEYYAIKKPTHILRQKTWQRIICLDRGTSGPSLYKRFNNTKDFPAEYQQIRMRIPDNSIQLENIKEHVKTMTCIPVTIACVCARGKFWCISTLSVFVLMYIYIICICLDVYLHYLYLSWCSFRLLYQQAC